MQFLTSGSVGNNKLQVNKESPRQRCFKLEKFVSMVLESPNEVRKNSRVLSIQERVQELHIFSKATGCRVVS